MFKQYKYMAEDLLRIFHSSKIPIGINYDYIHISHGINDFEEEEYHVGGLLVLWKRYYLKYLEIYSDYHLYLHQ